MPFKLFDVGAKMTVAELCAAQGVPYSHGCGYYQLSGGKAEKISAAKDLLLLTAGAGDPVSPVAVGAEAVRKKLGLSAGGELKLSGNDSALKSNNYWLFVNSTSPNRGLTAGTKVAISLPDTYVVTAKKVTNKALLVASSDDDDNDDDDDEEDAAEHSEEELDDEEKEERANLMSYTKKHVKLLQSNFIKHTAVSVWTSPKRGVDYIIRGFNFETGENLGALSSYYEDEAAWPRTWQMCEGQPVLGAIWTGSTKAPKLMAMYTMSLKGDESCMFYSRYMHPDDVKTLLFELIDDEGGTRKEVCPKGTDDVWGISSGDEEVGELRCLALEAFESIDELMLPGATLGEKGEKKATKKRPRSAS